MTDAAELVKLAEWIREPDFAESFTLADMADWMNRRPIGAVLKLAAQQDGAWQPIETYVPDDRDEAILIGCFSVHGNNQRVAWYDKSSPEYPWHVEDAADGFNHHKDWPTHWKQLDRRPV